MTAADNNIYHILTDFVTANCNKPNGYRCILDAVNNALIVSYQCGLGLSVST